VRVARACRELGVSPVGLASEADAGASWLSAFDQVVSIGGRTPKESYLRLEAVVQAALQTGCTAVHPGWGFLAESPRFAALCEQHGLTFVGPTAGIMERMALKWPAKRTMAGFGLEGIPGSDGLIPNAEQARMIADQVGYPCLLKADSGGGGRGMRKADGPDDVAAAFAAASAEASAAFGDGSLYLERYLTGGRHIEMQLLADGYGNAVHLGERECSIQRNHQKLIEESPSPVLAAAERERIGAAVAAAAASIGYTGAGTVEFLLHPDDGRLYFMEMNTRLQVEHPVSEALTGIDIVQAQLRIAANQPLGLVQDQIELKGHSIECRINAEDPSQDFRPSPGVLGTFEVPTDQGPGSVRMDTHLAVGDEISPYYDSLLAKVIVHAEDRAAAIETMERTLRATRIEGVATTIPLHLAVLASDEFRRGEYDTTTIPGWQPAAPASS
jgi:acetyl-CoA carboxylase biotin carboxylase subunit